ncbi:RagB/SusD family nutrient uptake outer membrane protein [Elizabethkingia sp. JS20170427COW]|uniref:RagB/SusD family nutrient uptake outer membrane protein n=1 Tax=Elizabethkingia sp. JS20170427COW TaxID=2583851 RepID=UPI0011101AB5|nr:RagB/SusD family nutrient uptake outer membrane protein [Elizabethkingia sp. JS20170427COW]QCX52931.1 RagB/SusD family nutrient uptake outer membrane protein [Elizabethkingia sp. JS20170427COW]
MTEASEVLPLSYAGGSGNEKGRITKGAALALKARVQLYYSMWADAATTAKQVMDLGTYSLFKVTEVKANDLDRNDGYENLIDFTSEEDKENFYKGLASYQQLFWQTNEGNNEAILTSQFLTNSSYEWSSGIYTILMPNQVSGWSSITPTVELVDAYWKRDGSKFTAPTPQERANYYNDGNVKPEYINEFRNRDTRLYAGIMFPTSKWNKLETNFTFNWPRGGNNTSKTGYNFKKLVDPNFKVGQYNSPQNYPLIRYAEVLLTYAEAKMTRLDQIVLFMML